MIEAVLQERRCVLSGCDPNYYAEEDDFGEPFEDEVPAHLVGSRVNGLVDKSWGPPVVEQVVESDVVWIRAGFVQIRERLLAVRSEIHVSEIAVREGIRAGLEPDDDGVQLADCANPRVVDGVVNDGGCNDEVERCINGVRESY